MKSCEFSDESDGCTYPFDGEWTMCYCSTDLCNDKLADGKTCPINETTIDPTKETTNETTKATTMDTTMETTMDPSNTTIDPMNKTSEEPKNNVQVMIAHNALMLICFLILNATVFNVI